MKIICYGKMNLTSWEERNTIPIMKITNRTIAIEIYTLLLEIIALLILFFIYPVYLKNQLFTVTRIIFDVIDNSRSVISDF